MHATAFGMSACVVENRPDEQVSRPMIDQVKMRPSLAVNTPLTEVSEERSTTGGATRRTGR